MKVNAISVLVIILSTNCFISGAQKPSVYDAIYSGVPWFDDRGNVVSVHGAGIIKDNDRYYLFGERKSDTSNAFTGFNCYSSADLYNWKFENIVLPVLDSGKLGPNRVGERPKVMKCPKTGEYVMYMHTDNLGYRDQCVGYATSKKINGTYTFHGALLYNGKPIQKWDMGVFQDTDGTGYILAHHGNIYQLSDDYKGVIEQILKDMGRGESPAVFKKDSIYYWLASDLTSWERNDNFYYTATSLKGPWTERGIFAPRGTLTWNSQTTYVLTIAGSDDTTYMFMGDRWSFPRQNSSATYVWQPLTVNGHFLSIPEFNESWQINTSLGTTWSSSEVKGQIIDNTDKKSIKYSGDWFHSSSDDSLSVSRSDSTGSSFSVKFRGTRIGLYGLASPDGGYTQVIIQNSEGETIISSIIDMYCKYSISSLKFLSPVLIKDHYTLIVTVMGEHGNWYNKKGTVFGSTGNFISVDKISINE